VDRDFSRGQAHPNETPQPKEIIRKKGSALPTGKSKDMALPKGEKRQKTTLAISEKPLRLKEGSCNHTSLTNYAQEGGARVEPNGTKSGREYEPM